MATPMGVSVIDEGQPGVPWTFQICEPATRPAWTLHVRIDHSLLETDSKFGRDLLLRPEARALALFLQTGLPWAVADN